MPASTPPMKLRSAAAAKRQRRDAAAQQAEKLLHTPQQKTDYRLAFVQREIMNTFFTWQDLEDESKSVLFDLPKHCKAAFDVIVRVESLVTNDDADFAPYRHAVLAWAAAKRLSLLGIVRILLPKYTAFAAATNFNDDPTNKLLRRVVTAHANFQAIAMHDAETVALRTELARTVAPLYMKLGSN